MYEQEIFKRLIHPRSLSRTINISMLNLISIGTEKRKTWEDELPFSINDTPFVKTFLINEEKGDESKRRKEETQRIADLSIPTTATCLPLFLDLIKNLSLRSDSLLQKERRKKNMESSRPLLKISFLIPSLFFLSLYDYLSQMNREERGKKVSNGKFVRGIAKIIRFSKKASSIMEFLNLNFRIFQVKIIWSYTTGKLIQIMKIRGSKDNLMIHWNI